MWFLFVLFMFLLALSIHCAVVRQINRFSPVICFIFIGVTIGIILLGIFGSRFGFTEKTFAALIIYMAFCELYIFTFTLVSNAVSVSILDRLLEGPIDVNALDLQYSTQAMVEKRVVQLMSNGFMLEKNGHLELMDAGKKLVNLFSILRNFFGHDSLEKPIQKELRKNEFS